MASLDAGVQQLTRAALPDDLVPTGVMGMLIVGIDR
ncbi:uncharacterized protein SOCE26_064010 [Sorangium cellulosum]|uniref:Uncharacterized protein n=1 Tax=Sorangium cellulosum TaxID=56 RepID=A0A2L0F058_SORCE|nr:uncharacterized protein SOCE26_064010 [Sorangium cellulosum]